MVATKPAPAMHIDDLGVAAAGRAPAGPQRPQRAVQVPQLLLSLLVVVVCALLAVWWQARASARIPVVAFAADVSAGVPLAASDLMQIRIDADIPPEVSAGEFLDVFVGAVPIADFSAGTLVTDELVVATRPLAAGQAFVGLRLDADRAPGGLRAGDRVQVLDDAGGERARVLAPDALVESVTVDGDRRTVRLRMSVAQAQVVQVRADSVVMIEIDNSGPAGWAVDEGDGS